MPSWNSPMDSKPLPLTSMAAKDLACEKWNFSSKLKFCIQKFIFFNVNFFLKFSAMFFNHFSEIHHHIISRKGFILWQYTITIKVLSFKVFNLLIVWIHKISATYMKIKQFVIIKTRWLKTHPLRHSVITTGLSPFVL